MLNKKNSLRYDQFILVDKKNYQTMQSNGIGLCYFLCKTFDEV